MTHPGFTLALITYSSRTCITRFFRLIVFPCSICHFVPSVRPLPGIIHLFSPRHAPMKRVCFLSFPHLLPCTPLIPVPHLPNPVTASLRLPQILSFSIDSVRPTRNNASFSIPGAQYDTVHISGRCASFTKTRKKLVVA